VQIPLNRMVAFSGGQIGTSQIEAMLAVANGATAVPGASEQPT
jgi:hypothetical protein